MGAEHHCEPMLFGGPPGAEIRPDGSGHRKADQSHPGRDQEETKIDYGITGKESHDDRQNSGPAHDLTFALENVIQHRLLPGARGSSAYSILNRALKVR